MRHAHKRTAHRWRLITIMVVGGFFALGSFWLVQMVNRGGDPLGAADKREPDYIVENFSFVRMSPAGTPHYIISGDRLAHRPIDDTSMIDQPVVQSITAAHPPMTMTALRARIRHAENEVELLGKVDIERAPTATARRLKIRTEALTLYPDEDRMTSNEAVEVKLGDATIRGTGLQADNAAQTVHFSSKGQIVYPPVKPR